MSLSPFRINVLDASGTPVSGAKGGLKNILQITTNEQMDKIGSLQFTMPANDPKVGLIEAGRRFDVYDAQEGYIGRYIYRSDDVNNNEGKATITVDCWSILQELAWQTVGFARNYEADTVDVIIDDLLSDVTTTWTRTGTTPLGTASVTYQGQTYLEAIQELSKRWGYHYRLTSTLRELEYGELGSVASVRLTNLYGQNALFESQSEVAIVKRISVTTNVDELYNRVIALGAGEGAAQLILNNGETGDFYTVQQRTGPSLVRENYIEDATSVTAYGARELVLIFDQIRPIANTATARTQAQTELLFNAEKFIQRYKDPRVQLGNVEVYGLPAGVLVGDKINVRYMGLDDDGINYLNVDGDFWITKLTRTRNATGQRIARLELVNVDRPEANDLDMMVSAVKAIRSERLWIKPTAFRFENTYYDSGQYFYGATSIGKNAQFLIDIDDTVTDVTRCVIRWKTYPLWNAAIADSWGAATVSAGAVPNQPTIKSWALTLGSLYPKNITMKINGVNVNNHADIDYIAGGTGPWNSGGANASFVIEMDITDYIINVGIYNDFVVTYEFGAVGSENIAYPNSFVSPITVPGGGSHGFIEFTVKMQGVAQALYKD